MMGAKTMKPRMKAVTVKPARRRRMPLVIARVRNPISWVDGEVSWKRWRKVVCGGGVVVVSWVVRWGRAAGEAILREGRECERKEGREGEEKE